MHAPLRRTSRRRHGPVTAPRPERGAGLAEKTAELKARAGGGGGGDLGRAEAGEAVALGIDGKRALWKALAAAADETPALRGPDYGRLEQRADDQRRRLETV